MKQNLMNEVIQGMLPFLNNAQMERLQEVLQHTLSGEIISLISISLSGTVLIPHQLSFKVCKYSEWALCAV